ncbi:MAG: hypothetical protein EA426_18810 [Spirochaetaceae bacterium]|nr:MAG: hypothetical protein EA426_18810 [Spirochaetaceae bacterium]
MSDSFPRTDVGGVSLSRMIIGTNWVLGYSHTSPAADSMIKTRHSERDSIAEMLEVFLNNGVDTLMGLFRGNKALCDARKLAEDRTGKKLIVIDTPPLNVDDTPEARREAQAVIAESAENGATFCFPHHSSTEQLVNKNLQAIPRLPDYLAMIREHGMVPGLSAHMPELVTYSDMNEYDVETYIQIYNCIGFLMQIEVEYIHKVIQNAKKPVMTIKSMAAGRVSPFVGITFSYATIRPCDMVTVGCFTPEEAREDIEIGRAAIERRAPVLAGRASPKKTAIMA